MTFAPLGIAKAGGLGLSTHLALNEDAVMAGVAAHLGVVGSGIGLATSAQVGSSFDGDLVGAFSGQVRYTLDVFTYVPWVGVGFGLRTGELIQFFPEASIGCSMMLGFDDSVGIVYKTPLIFQSFSSAFPFELGLYWSRNF